MSTIVLACRTIAHELTMAVEKTGVSFPVYWIDSKLHVKPENLKAQVQATIDRISNVDTIFLSFGLCGNSLVGVGSEDARLILPRVEDCISLLLGSQERRAGLARRAARYYFTRGWLESENNIADEYEYCVRKFGPIRGVKIMQAMLKNYQYLSFIETGGYDIVPYVKRIRDLARKLGLGHQVLKGSPRFFEKLLTGPWDGEFIVTEPGDRITIESSSLSIGEPGIQIVGRP